MSDLEKLTQEIRLATNYQVNKRILREKIQTDLHVPYNGGLFKASPELILLKSIEKNYSINAVNIIR